MATKANTVEDLKETIEIKDKEIKRLNRDMRELEREKDRFLNELLKERAANIAKDEELQVSRKELEMYNNRVRDAERKIRAEYERKLKEVAEQLQADADSRELKLVEDLQKEQDENERELREVIDTQMELIHTMQDALSKQQGKKWFGWFKGLF